MDANVLGKNSSKYVYGSYAKSSEIYGFLVVNPRFGFINLYFGIILPIKFNVPIIKLFI